MAKRAVDVAVTLKRSLRFTLRTAEEFVSPTLRPARGQEDASAALLPPRRTSAGGPAFAPQGGPARSENLDKGEGVIALQGHCIPAGTHFVDAASSPEDVLAVMVGKVVAGKTTFAIPIDMLVSSKPSAPDSTSAIEVDEGVQLENPRREADESNDADSNPLLNAIVSSVSAMQLTPSSDNGSLNAVAMHGIAHSRSVSLKEAASVALKPTDLSRLDFQKQQEQFHERSRLGAPSLSRSAAHDSAPPLSLIDRCVELAANWKLPELTSFLEQHHKVINPASLRCGDEQATLLHFVATHTPSPMSMRHANSKGNDRQPHLQDQCFQLVRYLVDVCGVPINGGARNGATPLHWAAGHGNEEVVLAFLEAGADKLARTWTWDRSVFGRGSGQTPLHWAAESGHAGVVDILLTHTPTSASGMRASDNNVIPHLELLLAAVPDERGHTPADVAGHNLQWDVHSSLQARETQRYVFVDVETIP